MMITKKFPAIRIGILTSFAIIIVKVMSILLVYHLLQFDYYLTIVAIAFSLTGYFLHPKVQRHDLDNKPASQQIHIDKEEQITLDNDRFSMLKAMFREITPREFCIFRLLAERKSNKEIAQTLGVEVSTIKTHINHLYAKIECKNRSHALHRWNEMKETGINL